MAIFNYTGMLYKRLSTILQNTRKVFTFLTTLY